ncbi:response regulator transcription factor [Pontibacter sp. KCTC 32443]|uniref:LytR/AlgR family response regulator transcription factor n=1 Tax=Pontibacter TaxID=323449 RepID=UPI00164EC672|nr:MULTISPECIES: LytTR family DNA-binding domain-containing protein [Pontibacter]MBC5772835.1 response regulator transcription factor [Pontibacter sp. KCTC 32443]
MDVLIIEDEAAAASRISKMLQQLDATVRVLDVTDSIESSVQWLENNPQPDLILSDIHLADGSSFEIFRQTLVEAPVIFTTAYDQYAIDAFKLNSIDYLLKPIKLQELAQSLEKFKKTKYKIAAPTVDYTLLLQALQPQIKSAYQKRLVIKFGQHLKTVEIAEVAYFYTQERVTHLCTFEGKRLPIDQNLDEVEDILDPAHFFRINRQFIINIKAIDAMYSYSKARVKIDLNPASVHETIVSTERAATFKQWLVGK